MGLHTDDGFIIESRDTAEGDGPRARTLRWIVLAIDETEALQLLRSDMPGQRHVIVASGDDIRAQAARLGVEPGTFRQI